LAISKFKFHLKANSKQKIVNSKNNGIKKEKKTILKQEILMLRYDTVWFINIHINFSLFSLGKQLVHVQFFGRKGIEETGKGATIIQSIDTDFSKY